MGPRELRGLWLSSRRGDVLTLPTPWILSVGGSWLSEDAFLSPGKNFLSGTVLVVPTPFPLAFLEETFHLNLSEGKGGGRH